MGSDVPPDLNICANTNTGVRLVGGGGGVNVNNRVYLFWWPKLEHIVRRVILVLHY